MRACVLPGAGPRPSSTRSSGRRPGSLLGAVAGAAVLLAIGAAPAAAASSAELPPPALSPADCPANAKGRFVCAILPVPLDHSGRVPGGLGLRVMVQNPTTEAQRHQLLVVLSGGPGQAAADNGAGALERSGKPDGYRVVTLDQRGTGKLGALVCPALSRVSAQAIRNGTCAGQIGDRRRFYATRDTVADLELLRRALGADRMALMGTSYGTFVAQQYARIHPTTTAALILDSPVPAAGVEAFGTTSYAAMTQVLRNQCSGGRCRGITGNPVGDLRRTLQRLRRTQRARIFSARGRATAVRLRGHDPVIGLLGASDLNPVLRAALPAALHRSAAGDFAPLARLIGTEAGARPEPQTDLSYGLNVTTNCLDATLPYTLAQPTAEREARSAAGLAAIPARSFAPFSRRDVDDGSLAAFCEGWPMDVVAPPSTDPIGAVPTVVLSGEDDVRTPLADARVLTGQIPGATLHRFPGVGHGVLGADYSGCARRIVRQLLAGTVAPTGSCGGSDNRFFTEALPIRRLADVRGIARVPRGPARIVNAVFRTYDDATFHDRLHRFADAGTRGGGLRGGRYRSSSKAITLTRYALIPGVQVTGRFVYRRRGFAARVRVEGPGRLDGRLHITPTRIRGTIGGVRLRLVTVGT